MNSAGPNTVVCDGGDTTVAGFISLGADSDTVSVINGGILRTGQIFFSDSDDTGTIDLTNGTIFANIDFNEANDRSGPDGEALTISGAPIMGRGVTISGFINGSTADNTINLINGAVVSGNISPDEGDDTIFLSDGAVIGDNVGAFRGSDRVVFDTAGAASRIRGGLAFSAGDDSQTIDMSNGTIDGSISLGDGNATTDDETLVISGGPVTGETYTVGGSIFGDAGRDEISLTNGAVVRFDIVLNDGVDSQVMDLTAGTVQRNIYQGVTANLGNAGEITDETLEISGGPQGTSTFSADVRQGQ